MQFGRGHWYRCPQGHLYTIGECGRPMQQSSCPECGATIGGQNHTLTRDNVADDQILEPARAQEREPRLQDIILALPNSSDQPWLVTHLLPAQPRPSAGLAAPSPAQPRPSSGLDTLSPAHPPPSARLTPLSSTQPSTLRPTHQSSSPCLPALPTPQPPNPPASWPCQSPAYCQAPQASNPGPWACQAGTLLLLPPRGKAGKPLLMLHLLRQQGPGTNSSC
ncbi:unnamed protein product [Caretta caretta]